MSPEPVIAVTGLIKSHSGLKVLDGIDLEVRAGEVAVVIGPSGGGKSTLLRCINGLEPFQGGSVRVGEHSLGAGPSAASLLGLRRTVGMVFQQFNLFPHMTVLDNVTLAPQKSLGLSRDQAESEARALLDRVGLGEKLTARPDQLSGGQQQRVAIARALAVRPRAILFDEPTSALDPRMAAEVLAVISDLARDGQTMVVVTHAMAFARQAATTVHVMSAGRVAESGPPADLFAAPRSEVARQFLAELTA
ncbi:MAG: amino acid ABC transporter ATP-binding protein [Gemmataceae bacterium]|nr:amino acid ABC transporter ATP-binding protein [Gemmataceae bacterium]